MAVAQKIEELTALAKGAPDDLLVVVDDPDVPGKITRKLGFGIFLKTYNRSAAEISLGLSNDDLDFKHDFGVVLRFEENTVPGTTPMATAIQKAIDSYDYPYIPTGIYLLEPGAAVAIPAGKYLNGDGYGSQLISNTPDDIMLTVNGSNVRIDYLRLTSGGKTLNESEAPFGANINLDGVSTSTRLSYISITNCTIENGHTGVDADYIDYLKVTDNHFLNLNTGWTQAHIWDCKHGIVSNNTMLCDGNMANHVGLWGPTAFDEKSEFCVVSANTMIDCKHESIQALGSGHAITGNTIRHLSGLSTAFGIQIWTKGVLNDTNDNVVNGNTISGTRYGIMVFDFDGSASFGPKNTAITGNTITECLGHGILIQNQSHRTNINGNIVDGTLATFSTGDGILIQSDKVKCDNNISSNNALNGIKISGFRSNCSLCYNLVEGNIGDGIEEQSGTGTKVIGNIALNNGGWGIQVGGSTLPMLKHNTGSGNTLGLQNSPLPALDDTGTPSVTGSDVFRTGGTTTITDLDDGFKGQEVTIFCEHAVTFDFTGTSLKGSSVDIVVADGDMIRFALDNDGSNWRLIEHNPSSLPTEIVTTTNVITATEIGKTFFLNAVGGFTSTLPAPANGLKFTFIVTTAPTTAYIITTTAGANLLFGTFLDIIGELVYFSAQDTLNFVASISVIGDRLEIESDGTNWYCKAFSGADGGITVSVT